MSRLYCRFFMTAMSVFPFKDGYHEKCDSSVVESDDEQWDFDTDLDASDLDLLELN